MDGRGKNPFLTFIIPRGPEVEKEERKAGLKGYDVTANKVCRKEKGRVRLPSVLTGPWESKQKNKRKR